MNKFSIAILIALLGFNAQSQIARSFLSGNLGLNSTKRDVNSLTGTLSNTNFSVGTQAGFFVSDQLAVGGSLSYGTVSENTKNKASNAEINRLGNNTIGASAFARYYFGKYRLWGYAGGGVGFSRFSQTTTTPSTTDTRTVDASNYEIFPQFQAGIVYFMGTNWSIDAQLTSRSWPVTFRTVGVGVTYWAGAKSVTEKSSSDQLSRGGIVVGGGFSVGGQSNNNDLSAPTGSAISSDGNDRTAWFITPSVGYFVADRTVLSLSFTGSFGDRKDRSRTITASTTGNYLERGYSTGLSLKRYLSANQFTPFVSAGVGITRSELEYKNAAGATTFLDKSNVLSVSALVGIAYLIDERFIIEGSIGGITHTSSVNLGTTARSATTGLNLSFTPSLSLQYVLKK